MKRMAEATGLTERTVCGIHKEHVARDGQLLTPVKRYTASRIRINLDTLTGKPSVDSCMPSTSEGNTPPSLQCSRRPERSVALQVADSASGEY